VRELKNFIERLAILSDSKIITLQELPEKIRNCRPSHLTLKNIRFPEQGIDFYDAVDQFEKSLIIQALDRTGWNKNKAALMLKMNRTTLLQKMKKKEIRRQRV
jgi:DNA-binding NtrC family response regulator